MTKLSLLLKVLEGENEETLQRQLKLFRERALPDLANNIKCGNSLIGPDFYAETQMSMFDEEERLRINVFDWKTEFAEIMGAGGFDAVIGNPPYIRIQTMKEWAPNEVEFYKKQYESAIRGNYDIYVVFVERALDLLQSNGMLGFIVPHKFFNAKYGLPLRSQLSVGKHLFALVHFGDQQVFAGATTYTCLLFLSKSQSDSCSATQVCDLSAWRADGSAVRGIVDNETLSDSEWNFVIGPGGSLYDRLSSLPVKLGEVADVFVGLQTSADTVFLFKESTKSTLELTEVFSKALQETIQVDSELLKPVIRSGSIGRYWAKPSALVLFPYDFSTGKAELIPESIMRSKFRSTWDYLVKNKRLLEGRESGKFRNSGWYQLYPKNLDLWDQEKIMAPYMITRLSAYLDTNSNYFCNVTTGGFGLTPRDDRLKIRYLVGLLNSRLLDWFLKQVSTTFHGGYFAANKQYLVQLPIVLPERDRKQHADRVCESVDQMQSLHQEIAAAKTTHQRTALSRQIAATDAEIDRLVYELYELTDEEIRIVEEATQ